MNTNVYIKYFSPKLTNKKKERYLLGVAGVFAMSSKALSIERDGESLEWSITQKLSHLLSLGTLYLFK